LFPTKAYDRLVEYRRWYLYESCRYLHVDGQIAILDDDKLTEIRMLEQQVREMARRRFRVGQRVRIRSGTLVGQAGIIERLDDHERVVLLLEFLGQQSRVRMATEQIEAVV
jgi:transcription antitermination factor NusG